MKTATEVVTSRTVLHSMNSNAWFTPAPIVEAARVVLGQIDLDPASCAQANQAIRATRFYTTLDDGLKQPWAGRIFLNPPGGRGLVTAFWGRLVEAWRSGCVPAAVWVGYSLEQLQTLQSHEVTPLDFPLCVPRRRIAFESPDGGKNSPTHANYLTFLPDSEESAQVFEKVFGQFGRVINV